MNSLGNNNDGAVAGSFNFAAQLPNGKSLTFSGYVMAGETEEEVNAKLDFASRAVERQRLIAEIPELETKLEMTRDARSQVEAILAEIAGKERPTAQERQTANTHRVNLKKLDHDIAKGEAAIAKTKGLVSTVAG